MRVEEDVVYRLRVVELCNEREANVSAGTQVE